MARSYVGEARRRGLGRRRDRIGPIVERLAREHADATIALRFRSDVELLISVMLSAQTTDVNVNRVTERLFEKYRRPEDYLAVPVGGARAGHLRDRLLPPEDEVDPRRDARPARGVRRRGASTSRGPAAPSRRRAQDGQRRRGRARARPGHRRGHPRPASLAATRPDAERGSGEDRARPAARRPACRLGAVPAPADLARATDLRRTEAAVRGVCARRPVPRGPRR